MQNKQIYRGFFLSPTPGSITGMVDIRKDEHGPVIHTARNEDDAYKWVDAEKKKG